MEFHALSPLAKVGKDFSSSPKFCPHLLYFPSGISQSLRAGLNRAARPHRGVGNKRYFTIIDRIPRSRNDHRRVPHRKRGRAASYFLQRRGSRRLARSIPTGWTSFSRINLWGWGLVHLDSVKMGGFIIKPIQHPPDLDPRVGGANMTEKKSL